MIEQQRDPKELFREGEYKALRAEIGQLSLLGHQTERNGLLSIVAVYSFLFATIGNSESDLALSPLVWFMPPLLGIYVFFRVSHYHQGVRDIGRFLMIQHELPVFPNEEVESRLKLVDVSKSRGWETFIRTLDLKSVSVNIQDLRVSEYRHSDRKSKLLKWFWLPLTALTLIIAFVELGRALNS